MNRFLMIVMLAATGLLPVQALGQTCTAVASPLEFGTVAPIEGASVDTTGQVTVTCTWPFAPPTRHVLVCLNLGAGSGAGTVADRNLVNGNRQMKFNVYRDAARVQRWGRTVDGPNSPISMVLVKDAFASSKTARADYFARIAPNQPGVPTVNNESTLYNNIFSGSSATISTYPHTVFESPTCSNASQAGNFSLEARAMVVNKCIITTQDVDFGTAGILDSALSARGALNVRCTNANAYRISLSAGGSGNVAARRMLRSNGAGSINYQLYSDASHGAIWGDGGSGTSMVTGTGTGNNQILNVYGLVPAQQTPAPGNYTDTITATVYF